MARRALVIAALALAACREPTRSDPPPAPSPACVGGQGRGEASAAPAPASEAVDVPPWLRLQHFVCRVNDAAGRAELDIQGELDNGGDQEIRELVLGAELSRRGVPLAAFRLDVMQSYQGPARPGDTVAFGQFWYLETDFDACKLVVRKLQSAPAAARYPEAKALELAWKAPSGDANLSVELRSIAGRSATLVLTNTGKRALRRITADVRAMRAGDAIKNDPGRTLLYSWEPPLEPGRHRLIAYYTGVDGVDALRIGSLSVEARGEEHGTENGNR